MSDLTRPQYLLDRDRDIQTINESLDRTVQRRADYEVRLAAERDDRTMEVT